MGGGPSTAWTLIEGAAAGDDRSRALFADRYLPAVRAYLVARWRGTPLLDAVEDATQDVFVDCFRAEGALARLDPSAPGGFRAFLYGVARNAARHVETRRARRHEREPGRAIEPDALAGPDESPDAAFDRAWAVALVREALALQRVRAREGGEAACRRIELLRLRFAENLPVREVARLWSTPAARIHKEYAQAREEFRAALVEVLAAHRPPDPEAAARELGAALARIP